MTRPKRGTKAGEEASRKYRETMARKYGEDGVHKFFANIGSKGGRAGSRGGFAADPTKAILAGTIGGLRSKRTPSEDFIIVAQDCGDTTRYEIEEIVSRCTRSMFAVEKTDKSAKIKVRTTEKAVERIVKRLSYLNIKATYEEA